MLRALLDLHSRLAAEGVLPPPGFEDRPVAFELVLAEDGCLLEVIDTRSEAFPLGARHVVPRAVKRSGARPAPNLLWDHAEFVLGAARRDRPAGKDLPEERLHRFAAVIAALPAAARRGTGIPAVLTFLNHEPARQTAAFAAFPAMLEAGWTISFRLSGHPLLVCEEPALRPFLQRHVLAPLEEERPCLVTGMRARPARLHPGVRGVPGAQATGAGLVTFNLKPLLVHGLQQGEIAPVAGEAADGYGSALNHLLNAPACADLRLPLGRGVLLAWGEQTLEAGRRLMAALERLDMEPDQDKGGPPAADAEPLHVVLLEANGSRLFVRRHDRRPLGEVLAAVDRYRSLLLSGEAFPQRLAFTRLVTTLQEGARSGPGLWAADALLALAFTTAPPDQRLVRAVAMDGRRSGEVRPDHAALATLILSRVGGAPSLYGRRAETPAYRLGEAVALAESLQNLALPEAAETLGRRLLGEAMTGRDIIATIRRQLPRWTRALSRRGWARRAAWHEVRLRETFDHLAEVGPARAGQPLETMLFMTGYYERRFAKRTADGAQAV